MGGDRIDFFVSHAGADRAWAEWVAWQLTEAGYTVELDVWDWAAGRNFVTAMSDALDRCDRVVALFSAAYFDRSRYTTEEWSAAMLHVPGMEQGRLVPVRVDEVPSEEMPAVLRPLVHRDLFGVEEHEARQVLLEVVAGPRRPDQPPVFPGPGGPTGPEQARRVRAAAAWDDAADLECPGAKPRVHRPGRDAGGHPGAAAGWGSGGGAGAARDGGVGKTQLAAEYAHRFAETYDLAWWINSEQGGLIGDQFAALGAALGCVQPGAGVEVVRAAVLAELRERGRWLLVFDNAATPPTSPGGCPVAAGMC